MPANKKNTVGKTVKNKHIDLVRNDSWLEPFEDAIRGRHDHALYKLNELTNNGKQTLSDFASGYLYFGLHKTDRGWVFREWAPNATDIYLIGDFNDWKETEKYRMKRLKNGNWEIKLSKTALKHGQLYKLKVHWDGGEGERIPVSKYVYVFATEADRTSYLEMMSGVLYVVRATKKIYIYSGGWICLNDGEASDTYYFDIDNLEIPTGATGLRVTDSRISTGCTGTFTPIASLNDLYGSSTVTCSNGYATIVLSNTSYPMIGTLKISGSTTFSST